jgi:hypothetical protein
MVIELLFQVSRAGVREKLTDLVGRGFVGGFPVGVIYIPPPLY